MRYVLEGSVQRSANRMRVNVQLIDAESGNHLWADRFDKPVTDLFDMQDEIVARLANALNAQLIMAEARRAERAPNPDSMDLYFRGMSAYNKGLTPDNLSEARKLFERALALDPGNVDAIVGAALASIVLVGMHMSDDRAARLAAAEALAVKALSIAPENASGHCAWASSTSTPIGPRKAFPNSSERLRSTEIWPLLTLTLVWPRILLAMAKRLRITSRMRCG